MLFELSFIERTVQSLLPSLQVGAIGFNSSACSVCFDSSLYNDPSSDVSVGLRAASALAALTLSEGFFDLDEVLEGMSESSRGRF